MENTNLFIVASFAAVRVEELVEVTGVERFSHGAYNVVAKFDFVGV